MKCRKLLAILLALVMVIGLLPFAALADGSQDNQLDYIQGTDPDPVGDPGIDPGVDPDIQPDTDLNIDPDGEPDGNLLGDPDQDLAPGVMLLNDTHEGEGDWTALTNSTVSWELGDGKYYLDESLVGISQQIIIKGEVTLCLNGCTLKALPKASGAVKVSEGASLTICDCGNGGEITSDCNNTNPTLRVYGTCTLKSGAITVEDATASGGCAVRIDKTGVFTMTGGSLVGGKYGVYNQNVANLEGGTVSGVTAGAANETNPGRLNVAGSAIESSAGAAISLDHGSLDMTGGSASGTAADIELATSKRNNHVNIVLRIAGGSAGRIVHRSDYPLYLSGAPTVTSVELASVENQLFASENRIPYNGSAIAVSLQDPPEAGETVIQGISGNAGQFTYAGEGFELAEDGNGNLILKTPTTPPVEGHKHAENGTDGSEIWTEWDGQSDLKTGYYYLKDNVDISEVLAENNLPLHITGDVHLCLNGKTLEGSAETLAALIEISTGASLTICDCGEGGTLKRTEAFVTSSRGCVIDNSSGTLILYDGTIQNDAYDRTYAVTVSSSNGAASFEMYQDATIRSIGTGIRLYGGSNATTATIHGGTIEYAGASGISVEKDFKNSTLTIENISIDPGTSGEQGLYIRSGTVNIQDGNIRGKQYGAKIYTAQNNGETHISGGTLHGDAYGIEITLPFGENTCAPVYLSNAPIIDGNTADIHYEKNTSMLYAKDGENAYSGDNLSISCPSFVDGDVVVYEGSELQGKFSVVEEGKSLVVQGDNLELGNEAAGHQNHGINGSGEGEGTWTAWDPRTTKTLDGGYYYLDQNYDNLEAITVTGDAYLCLNGHEMSDNGGDADFITVNRDASLTICDCSKDKNKTGTINYKCTTGYAIVNNGALTLYSGKIYSRDDGDGIHIATKDGSDVKFDMEGGTIDVDGIGILFNIGKKEVDKVNINGGTLTYGGKTGVLFGAEGTLTVSGGTIQPRETGASNSQGISRTSTGDLNVTGGKISGEQCGIQITTAGGGEVEISGGNISASGKEGYGIYLNKSATETAKLYLSDTPTISGQKAALNIGKPNAVYASKNGQPYRGDNLTVAFTGNDTEAPIILDVNDYNDGNFTLVFPEDKTLVRQDDNLVLGEKTVEVPELVLSALPETVTYGETFTLTATGGSTTGTVTWTAEGAAKVDQEGNVTITGAGSFTITATKGGKEATATGTAAQKAITITANDQRLEHGETIEEGVQQVTVAALVAGDTLDSIVLTADDTDIEPSDAIIKQGDADVTAYYDISYEFGELTFYNVPQTGFAITDQPAAVIYGETFKLTATGGSGEGAVTWEATGAAKVDQEGNVTITGAGAFTITATKAGDDTFAAATATYQGTAQKRALTITAADETIAFNAAAPSYTATVAGAVQADKEAIADAYDLTSTYVKGNPVGNYPITVTVNLSDDLQAKYIVTANNGTLHVVETMAEVVQAPTAVENLVYTGKAQKLVTAGEAKNGTMVYSLNGTTYQEAVPTRINAGTYTVWYKVVGNNGYSDTAAKSFTVTIKKAPLTVTADDIWVYAGNTPKFTVTITGYVNGEDWRELGGKLTFTCGYSEKYSKPGSRYTITPEGLRADNYHIAFETGILTVKDPLSPRFNVYVLDSKHGTVEADCRYARKGDVVTLTIKPDWGYELETLTVTDSHGYELKLTYHSNGTYTFTMPRDNVTVKAIFTVRDMPFVDVPGDAWYAGGVRYVYAHGLMNGTGDWHFSPNRTTTRAMIATILYRMEGSPRVYGTSQFGDVEAGSWYEDAVIWATQNDIVEGYTSKTFGPNDPITREQMAAMLYRYADYCRCDMSAGRYVDLSKYSDMNEISDYAIPALRWAVGEEIIQGRTGKRLAPTDTATRAEVAVMLMRFCEDVIW